MEDFFMGIVFVVHLLLAAYWVHAAEDVKGSLHEIRKEVIVIRETQAPPASQPTARKRVPVNEMKDEDESTERSEDEHD